jgi:hypothetical protein
VKLSRRRGPPPGRSRPSGQVPAVCLRRSTPQSDGDRIRSH